MAIPLDDLLAYRDNLTDAVTGEAVTSSTNLVDLYQPDRNTIHGATLQNLVNVARPAEPVHIVTDGETFPPEAMEAGWMWPRYFILVTCNRLLTAPTIRLEVIWEDIRGDPPAADAPENVRIAIDFAFNANADGTPGLTNLSFGPAMVNYKLRDEMRFTAYGASSHGFPNVQKHQDVLGNHSIKLVAHLRQLLTRKEKRIRLAFTRRLDTAASGFTNVLPYIIDGPNKLPSLSIPAWSTLVPLRVQRDPIEMMNAPAPYPMVPFECEDSYPDITTATVELYESALIGHLEQEEALREWAKVPHTGILYEIGGAAVMAVQFAAFNTLGGARGVVKFDLPDRLYVKLDWIDPMTGMSLMAEANRCSVPVRLPTYDALFVIAEPSLDVRNACIKPTLELDRKFCASVDFAPKFTKFQLESQLSTAVNLQHPDASRFHGLILNQNHGSRRVDLATKRAEGIQDPTAAASAAVDEAFSKIMRWRNWNPEQEEALLSIRAALAGTVLISGPAGTGKTLVLQAICAFLYAIGLHVLVLAPANSNCADFISKLKTHFPDIEATRVFPSSADFDPEKIGKERQHAARQQADDEQYLAEDQNTTPSCDSAETRIGDLLDFEMIRADLQSTTDKYSDPHKCALPAQVLKAAREHKSSLSEDSQQVDIWEELRQCIEKSDAGEFNWLDKNRVQSFASAYTGCKARFMSIRKLVVTTTGNARCRDIIDNFARDKHNVICEGLVIILDEAAKDREIDSLSPLLVPEYQQKITGMIMLGDERQLEPTNTSSKGAVVMNPFSQRLSMPFFGRLKKQGFPATELKEQHRMSHVISKWPSANFYPEGMRDGPGTKKLLRTKQPGLYACLRGILDNIGSLASSNDMDEDRRVRSHYLEVLGTRDNSKRSAIVREHVRFFLEKIFWPLHAYFGERFSEHCMVIVAYKGQKNTWLEALGHLCARYNIPTAQCPRVCTIDSSQGTEAPITILDCSVQKYSPASTLKDIGFVDDDKRMNVAMTRAQEVRWILGGSCKSANRRRRCLPLRPTPSYVRYRQEVEGTSECTLTPASPLIRKDDGGAWVDRLEKQDVVLAVRYADEMAQ